MSFLVEVARGLHGAWRLAHRDASAIQLFENTPDAVWRSFLAIIVAAPADVLLTLLRPIERADSESDLHFALVELLVNLIGWFAFPLAAYYLAAVLDCLPRFCRFVAAYNWASVLQHVAMVPVALLSVSEVMPDGIAALAELAVIVAFLGYLWFVARTALEIDGLMAAGFVLLDILVSMTLSNLLAALHLETL